MIDIDIYEKDGLELKNKVLKIIRYSCYGSSSDSI